MASRRALVVFSGGQDSTTCLYLAKEEHEFVSALTFAYAQRHAREIESAKKIASLANVEHEIVDLGPLFKGLSSLVDPSAPLPGASETTNHGAVQQLPSTFVPGRNMLFLSLAASRAYARDCSTLYIGVSQEDFAGYPDCREGFIK